MAEEEQMKKVEVQERIKTVSASFILSTIQQTHMQIGPASIECIPCPSIAARPSA
jgi:hypothetical protein